MPSMHQGGFNIAKVKDGRCVREFLTAGRVLKRVMGRPVVRMPHAGASPSRHLERAIEQQADMQLLAIDHLPADDNVPMQRLSS